MQLLPDIYEFKLSRQHYSAAQVSPDTNHEGKWQVAIFPQGFTGGSVYALANRNGDPFSSQGAAIAAATRELEMLY